MTAPRFAACRCGHPKDDHEGALCPQCEAKGCTCLQYRPDTAKGTPIPAPAAFVRREAPAVVPAPPIAPTPPTEPEAFVDEQQVELAPIELLLKAGQRSALKRTVMLAEKIARQVADLRARVAREREMAEQAEREEAAHAEASARIAKLERELAEARAALSPAKAAARKAPAEAAERVTPQGTCPDCGKGGLAAVGVHRARKHGYRRAGAA